MLGRGGKGGRERWGGKGRGEEEVCWFVIVRCLLVFAVHLFVCYLLVCLFVRKEGRG
jgi:hypothetical protein